MKASLMRPILKLLFQGQNGSLALGRRDLACGRFDSRKRHLFLYVIADESIHTSERGSSPLLRIKLWGAGNGWEVLLLQSEGKERIERLGSGLARLTPYLS